MKRIGFTKVYFTLWEVSVPTKHYYGTDKMDWEMRINYFFIQNLSKDEARAKHKAEHKFGVTNLEVDTDLYGRSNSFWIAGEKGTDRPPPKDWEFPQGIHRYGVGDIRTMGMRPVNTDKSDGDYVHFSSVEDKLASERNDADVKALWTLYLKKEIVFEPAKNLRVRAEWRRPIVYARMQLVKLGVIVKHDGKWMASSYVDKYDERKKIADAKAQAKDGHHFEAKAKVSVNVKEIDCMHFEGYYGRTTYLITMIDDKSRKFLYIGNAPPPLELEGFTKVMATVKLDEYKGVKQTKLQRIRIIL